MKPTRSSARRNPHPLRWELWTGLLPGLYMVLIGLGGLVWLSYAGA
ncbi:MAG: hypothetical protein J0H49_25245 [Acidobacteria bacterium]|nr:hypothetical protein [Acidobacteriota bacterium]